jgi:hypothetical protein
LILLSGLPTPLHPTEQLAISMPENIPIYIKELVLNRISSLPLFAAACTRKRHLFLAFCCGKITDGDAIN